MEESLLRERVRTFWDKAQERLKAAHLLYREGFYEEAISTAYYAALWAARALLLVEGAEPRTHEGVRTLLGFYYIRPGRMPHQMGKIFNQRLDERMRADYSADTYLDAEDVEQALQEATQFLQVAQALLTEGGYLEDGASTGGGA